MTAQFRIHQSMEQGVLTFRLDRPGALNCWDLETLTQFREELVRHSEREDLRAVVLTGAGGAFSAGAWIPYLLEQLQQENLRGLRRLAENTREILLSIRRLPQFTIAALNGPALDGGLNLALACDCVLAGRDVVLGYPFVEIGLQPDVGSGPLLTERLGAWEAMRCLLEGKLLSASTAKQMGLLQEVISGEELVRRTLALAGWAASLPPVVLRGVKRGLQRSIAGTSAWDGEVDNRVRSLLSHDFHEGVAAFIENRRPRFTGH